MHALLHSHSPLRIFAGSGIATVGVLAAVLWTLGIDAAVVTLILMAVEIAFSFDNAIINAKILAKLSKVWQDIFLTVGMVVAVLGMRVVFPILIVAITAHLSWNDVLNLALHHPDEYSHRLEAAHPSIAAFGGSFLLMLALHFFLDGQRKILWLKQLERQLQNIARVWMPAALSALIVVAITLVPANHHPRTTLTAGLLGIITYLAVHALSAGLDKTNRKNYKVQALTGMAALWSFVYLEVLDASFSFDGVIGAFAITSKVVLIAAGLGVGALWVRSLTVFMVRRGTLANYIYLEHGAHYTVAVLAFVMLVSVFFEVPDALAGVAGIGLLGASALASRQALLHSR
ncbi:MAG TPA: DUF475 domain-containing protein [Nevskiaceae bacterium]|nr:DUF475 domain-containing protein [Nevskiaceae bacterium]